jgi:hypothetical protein
VLTGRIALDIPPGKLRWIPMPEIPPERPEPSLRATVLKGGPRPGEDFGACEVAGLPIARFAMPRLDAGVDWSELQAAFEFRGGTVLVSHGLWGDRHLWLEAMREHLRLLGIQVAGLEAAIDEMRKIEGSAFEAIRKEILAAAPVAPPAVDWDAEAALETLVSSAGSRKVYWDALVEVLTRRPASPEVIRELLGWVADPNWPGAGRAWSHLVTAVGREALPHIEMLVQMADPAWAENLRELAREIEG